MRKLTFLFCLIIFFLGQIFQSFVYAENSPGESRYAVDLGMIIITPKRVPEGEAGAAEDVAVMTEGDLKDIPARDLGEALKYVTGVDVDIRSQFGQATTLSIRGSQSRQVLLMVDGIPFNTQLSGQANPSRIPVEHIKRIEVIKGGASSVWGSSLGGVINVITKDVGTTQKPRGNLTTSWGEFKTFKENVEVRGKIKDLGYFLSSSYMRTDGAGAFSSADEKKGFMKLAHPLGDQAKIIGSFGYSGADVSFRRTTATATTHQPYISRYGKLSLDVETSEYNFSAAFKFNDQDIIADTEGASAGATVSRNLYKGISLVGSKSFREKDVLAFGADFAWHKLKSNKFLTTGKSIHMQAPFVNYTLKWRNLDVILGLRHDNNQHFGSQTSPSLGLIYRLKDKRNSLVRGKVSRVFNAPPVLWLFNNDGVFVGPNPDLRAERALLYELGFETKIVPSTRLELNLYRAIVKDAIALDTSSLPFIQRNFQKFRRQGVELLIDHEVNDRFLLYGSVGFHDVENRETKQTFRTSGLARKSSTFGARYQCKTGLEINLSGYYKQWSSRPGRANDRKPIFDAKLIKKFKDVKKGIDLETFLNIYNITNSKYWSDFDFPLPERYFEGGVSLNF